jgi:CDP-diacylglycerol pyrophosphatase
VLLLLVSGIGGGYAHADPDALWQIVNGRCVPDERAHQDPAPCAQVVPGSGPDQGYAVLKALEGRRQYLLIPTARIAGIESPVLQNADSPNYFAAAWRARSFLDEQAGGALPRDWVSLAINSASARSQDQMHIHIDCLSADVHDALAAHRAEIGPTWTPFAVPLSGRPYSAIAVPGAELDGVNPVALLVDGLDGARADMASRTIVVVGSVAPDGRPGFVVLAGRADPATGDRGDGEKLQDHNSCPVPLPAAS